MDTDKSKIIMDAVNIAAIVIGPVVAVVITLWWQERKEKRDAKMKLFVTLMAHRKSDPPPYEWVSALNLIDVVFEDCPRVVELWHSFYDLLQAPARTPAQDHKHLELLSEMARILGYDKIQQVDIDKFYSPPAHREQLAANAESQAELLRVLRNTSRFLVEQRGRGPTVDTDPIDPTNMPRRLEDRQPPNDD